MNARPILKTAGASLILTALLSSGVMPAQAAPGCTWPVQVNGGIGATCDRPQLAITQAHPATVGTPVLIEGSGFQPGEPVDVVDRNGKYNLSAVAGADGRFMINWAVPNYSLDLSPMFSATGVASQFETEAFQVNQDRAIISGQGGILYGWYPGEPLIVSVNGQLHSTLTAGADGTSGMFPEVTGPAGSLIEVVGQQSGGLFGRTALGAINGNVRPVRPVPVLVPAVPEPVVEVPVVPAPVLELPPEPVPVAKAPAPSRPQPQAAVVSTEADGALLASGMTVLTLLAGAASVLGIRRLRVKNNGQ